MTDPLHEPLDPVLVFPSPTGDRRVYYTPNGQVHLSFEVRTGEGGRRESLVSFSAAEWAEVVEAVAPPVDMWNWRSMQAPPKRGLLRLMSMKLDPKDGIRMVRAGGKIGEQVIVVFGEVPMGEVRKVWAYRITGWVNPQTMLLSLVEDGEW